MSRRTVRSVYGAMLIAVATETSIRPATRIGIPPIVRTVVSCTAPVSNASSRPR